MSAPRNTHTSIPSLVYDMLRAINQSRAVRRDPEAIVPHLPNLRIFTLMPDYSTGINWDKADQESLITDTLEAMMATVEFTQ